MNDAGAISRVMRLISLVADHADLTAKQAADQLGWPVSTTHRLLRTLAAAEFASQTGRGHFAPGLELYRIAGRLGGAMSHARVAQPLLESLSEAHGETSLMSILERRQLTMYIACSAAPKDPMRYEIELNRRLSLVWGASGRVMLACLAPAEVDRAIAMCEETDVHGNAVDESELRADLVQVARDGYCNSFSQRVVNAVGVAVPVFDAGNEVIASVAFQVPTFRFDTARLPALVAALKATARTLGQRMGPASRDGA